LESNESVSDLTDLSSDREDASIEDPVSTEDNDGEGNTRNSDPPLDEKRGNIKSDDNSEEFVEWEMV
jgi:hypothetical protein